MKRIVLLLLILFAGALSAQQINPTTQIQWPKATGIGAPTATCSAVNAGQPYTDTTTGNVQSYVCNGTAWQVVSGGGGSAAGPATSIQANNATGTGLTGDGSFLIDTTTHSALLNGNVRAATFTNLGTTVYDLNDTRFLGGLAAAVAGTTGYTPTQVMQNAADYGSCQQEMGLAKGPGTFLLPQLPSVSLSQVRFASGQSLIGRQGGQLTVLQHTGTTGAMLTQRNQGETLSCADGHTITFSGYMSLQFAYFAISGQNAGPLDVGIFAPPAAQSWWIHDISGANNEFGAQGILDQGFDDTVTNVGEQGGQIAGCSEFIRGTSPLSAGYASTCAGVEITGTDNEADYVYASDGAAGILGGSMSGNACYPNCAGIEIGGNNGRASHLFPQLNDIGLRVSGSGPMNIEHLRIDSSMREAIRSTNGANIADVNMYDPCNDSSLDAAFAAGTATNCNSITLNPGSQLSNINQAHSGQFHASNSQCVIFDTAQGDSGTPSTISNVNYKGNPDNLTANSQMVCVPPAANRAQSTMIRWEQPTMGSPVRTTTATANINGVTNLAIQTSTLTNATNGLPGQLVKIQADPFAPSGTATIGVTGNIATCSGLPITVTTTTPVLFQWTNNSLLAQLGCSDGHFNRVTTNWTGNPTPSDPSQMDGYEDLRIRSVPVLTTAQFQPLQQITGPTLGSGSYCFEQAGVFADGNLTSTPTLCVNFTGVAVDIANATSGFISALTVPNATVNLYLVSRPSGSTVPLGKYPAPDATGKWTYTVVAAGGDGSTPPLPGITNTGRVQGVYEVLGQYTVATLPSASAFGAGAVVEVTDSNGTAGTCVGGGSGRTFALSDGTNWICGGGRLPSAATSGQIVASTAAGSAYAAQPGIIYGQTGDTVASIASACASGCTYVVTQPQTLTITANTTLSSGVHLRFEKAGLWTVNGSTYTLTIPTHVEGTLSQHFAGSASIALSNQHLIPVEWFGAVGDWNGSSGTDNTAAIQACINALVSGQCWFQAKPYAKSGTINVTRPSLGILGVGNTLSSSAGTPTRIITTSASADMIDVSGTGTSRTQMLDGLRFERFSLERSVAPTGTARGFSASFTSGMVVDGVDSDDSIQPFYFHACYASGVGRIENTAALFGGNGFTETSGTLVGYYLDSADGNAENSIRLRNNIAYAFNGSATFYGMEVTGSAINDVMVDRLETGGGMSKGIVIAYTGTGSSYAALDLHFNGVIIDAASVTGVEIDNVPASASGRIEFNGGYIAGLSGNARAFDIENSYGVSITNMQLGPMNTGAPQYIYANGSSSLIISNNQIVGTATAGIVFNGTTNSVIAGNSIVGASATGALIQLTGSASNVVSNNALSGTAAIGISADASSQNLTGLETNQVASTITTDRSILGTSPLIVKESPAAGGTTVSTTFNERTSGTALSGSTPATDTPGGGWIQVGATNNATYNGAGVTLPGSGSIVINGGLSSYTATFTGVHYTSGVGEIAFNINPAYSLGLTLDYNPSSGNVTITDFETSTTALLNTTIGTNLTGTITLSVSGQSISVNFCGTPLSATIPAGSGALSRSYFGINAAGAMTMTGMTVSAPSQSTTIVQFGSSGQFSVDASGNATIPTIISVLKSSETVTFSATPTFSTATRSSYLVLTGNVTSFTLAAGGDGQEKTLIFCQDATGSRTVAAPTNVRGFFAVGSTASLCSSQHFTYSTGQSAWIADSPGVINQ